MKKWIWSILLGAFIIIQLFPSGRPRVSEKNPNDLLVNNELSEKQAVLLRSACYDCHSNETHYPWYSYVAPVSWLVSRDTRIGRTNLNFSDWESLSKMEKAKMLGEIAEEVEEGKMPMPIYVIMHPEAKLSASQRVLLIEWSDSFAESLFE